jgi:hypothetical protein
MSVPMLCLGVQQLSGSSWSRVAQGEHYERKCDSAAGARLSLSMMQGETVCDAGNTQQEHHEEIWTDHACRPSRVGQALQRCQSTDAENRTSCGVGDEEIANPVCGPLNRTHCICDGFILTKERGALRT